MINMLKKSNQLELSFSKHTELYDILIKPDNFWRQLNDTIDFSFVYEQLKDKYSSTMGRTCEDVIRMFKYLLLKSYFKLSDKGLIERTQTDLLFKYFLGYDPEETKLINPTLLTVFRRERLKDEEENLMDKLINKTVEIALEKGLIEVKNKIIVDSTHTNAMFHHISPREELIRQAKELRKSIYKIDESMHDKMPAKRETTGLLEDQIDYTKELLQIVKDDGRFTALPSIKEQIDYLEETMNDTEIELEYSKDQDAKVGHMAIRKAKQGSKNAKYGDQRVETYYFDVEKCKHCPFKEGCYKEGSKSKTYSVKIKNDAHIKHMDYMKSEEFKSLYKERYKIEAKNAELKNNYNYGNANACGKQGITIQGATTLFLTKMKRIIKLNEEKNKNIG